ncbi:SDR family NAD(P)-dependent oxidoreductase [Cereibacter sp. SYSU M97828]|nr:SDR family NAD(P)-dependent oxidoreductase [Cereibacter flavus]
MAAAAAQIERESGRLDALVNNAGLMFAPPPSATEEPLDQIRQMFDANVFGVLRVTQAFVPLLRKSQAGRIVMMSSGLASMTEALDNGSTQTQAGGGNRAVTSLSRSQFLELQPSRRIRRPHRHLQGPANPHPTWVLAPRRRPRRDRATMVRNQLRPGSTSAWAMTTASKSNAGISRWPSAFRRPSP